jgi:hypothetical protein
MKMQYISLLIDEVACRRCQCQITGQTDKADSTHVAEKTTTQHRWRRCSVGSSVRNVLALQYKAYQLVDWSCWYCHGMLCRKCQCNRLKDACFQASSLTCRTTMYSDAIPTKNPSLWFSLRHAGRKIYRLTSNGGQQSVGAALNEAAATL